MLLARFLVNHKLLVVKVLESRKLYRDFDCMGGWHIYPLCSKVNYSFLYMLLCICEEEILSKLGIETCDSGHINTILHKVDNDIIEIAYEKAM